MTSLYDMPLYSFHNFLIGCFPSDSLPFLQTIRGAGHYVYADQPEDFNYKVLEACNKLEWRQRRAWMLNSGGGKTGTDIILSHTVEPQNPTFPKDKNKCLHIKNIAKWTVAWCDSYMFYHLTSESAVFSETWWMVTLSWHHWLGPVGLHHMLILQHTESCGCSVTCFFFVIKVFC